MPRAAYHSSSRLLGDTSRQPTNKQQSFPCYPRINCRLYWYATFISPGLWSHTYLSDHSSVVWCSSEATAPPVRTPSTNVPSSIHTLRCPAMFHTSHRAHKPTNVSTTCFSLNLPRLTLNNHAHHSTHYAFT